MIVIVVALVVGCGPAADPKHPDPPPSNATKIGGTQMGGKSGGSSKPTQSGKAAGSNVAVVVPAIGCPKPTCVFHAGAAGYFTCLSSGAGACFHFGATCAPPDACMYDPSDLSYKQCARTSEGRCMQWGGTCAPATRCMFNPSDGSHHQCDEVAGGRCKRYGALCAP